MRIRQEHREHGANIAIRPQEHCSAERGRGMSGGPSQIGAEAGARVGPPDSQATALSPGQNRTHTHKHSQLCFYLEKEGGIFWFIESNH